MIKKATLNDIVILAKMASKIWHSSSVIELETEFKKVVNNSDLVFLIKYFNDIPVGFAHCTLRSDYVEGTSSSPVGYLEGIFVDEEYRRNGFAKELLEECIQWAKECGCTEFGSDCEINNNMSILFHNKLGFHEVNRIVCFTRKI